MKNIILSIAFIFALAGLSFAQDSTGHVMAELNSKGEPVVKSKENAPVELKAGESITRGDALAKGVMKVSVEKVLAAPDKYVDNTVEVEGVIIRSCKTEGCWMEMADKAAGKSVRVTFGDHKFFIPLNSAGMKVKAQGQFKTKVLPKDHVEHLIKDDGAKFDKRNADGSVTEVSFDATGVVLTKQ